MNKQLLGLMSCVALLATSGCVVVDVSGSGYIDTREVEVSEFRAIDVCCGFDVDVYESEAPSLVITGDDNIIEDIIVTETDGTLKLELPREMTFRPSRRVDVSIGTAALDGVDASGGADVTVRGVPQGDAVVLDLSGGSSIEFTDVVTASLNADLSGGSDAELSGMATDQVIRLSGGSIFRGYELSGDAASVDASGGSRAQVAASTTLDVDASGGSSVRYDGEPMIDESISGGSSVSAR